MMSAFDPKCLSEQRHRLGTVAPRSAGCDEFERDQVAPDLLDHDLKVGPSSAVDQRPLPVQQLLEPTLDQRAKLEPSTNLVDELVVFQRYDHGHPVINTTAHTSGATPTVATPTPDFQNRIRPNNPGTPNPHHSMQFNPDDKIRHAGKPEWGTGVVLSVQRTTQDGKPCQRLTVRFDHAGKKTISTAFADIRHLEPASPQPANSIRPGGTPKPRSPAPASNAHHAHTPRPAEPETHDPELLRRRLQILPEETSDPFSTLEARLRATLSLYRYDQNSRLLLDWASSQTGLRDALSVFSRHDLERGFEAFRINLDRHLRDLLNDSRRGGIDTAPILADAPPAVQHALRRINPSR